MTPNRRDKNISRIKAKLIKAAKKLKVVTDYEQFPRLSAEWNIHNKAIDAVIRIIEERCL